MGAVRETDLSNNELTGLPIDGPKFDLVGPTVDDDIRRAITRYGADAVKEAIKRQAKPKRGRKPEKDWLELREVIEADARAWLAGGDPLSSRSNYSIAKDFADKNPGHSHPATMKRIERKLVQKRAWMTFVTAENFSRAGYPHAVYIRALEELSKVDSHPVWASILDGARSKIADYEAKMGEPPPAELSMDEVESAGRNALLTLSGMVTPKKPRGLFGLTASYAPNTKTKD